MTKAYIDEPEEWILCPRCRAKTRVRIREDTIAKNLPVFCPKCKAAFLVEAQDRRIKYILKPDA